MNEFKKLSRSSLRSKHNAFQIGKRWSVSNVWLSHRFLTGQQSFRQSSPDPFALRVFRTVRSPPSRRSSGRRWGKTNIKRKTKTNCYSSLLVRSEFSPRMYRVPKYITCKVQCSMNVPYSLVIETLVPTNWAASLTTESGSQTITRGW